MYQYPLTLLPTVSEQRRPARFLFYRLGAFEPAAPPAPGTRATVSFDSLEVFTEGGGRRLLSAGWVFALARAVNPALANGRS